MTALEIRPGLEAYTINLVGHSQGAVVVSEAMLEGAPFDNCILSQGAVPAHAYDPRPQFFLQKFSGAEAQVGRSTPLSAALGGFTITGGDQWERGELVQCRGLRSQDRHLFWVGCQLGKNQVVSKPDVFGRNNETLSATNSME